MKYQILIPTYNRCADLHNNLYHLRSQLLAYRLQDNFGIVVSDNASSDGTWSMVHDVKNEWKDEIRLDLLRNERNVGLEQNVVNLLSFATSEYIIWLGDDDLLAEGYLKFVDEEMMGSRLGWIIPGIIQVNSEGKRSIVRPVDFDFKRFAGGFNTVYQWSHLGHQMSGLVVKRNGLKEHYFEKPEWRNPYLFIFFIAYCQLHYDGIYAPSYPSLINNYNPKDWTYNDIGLLDEVFKSYYYLKYEIGQGKLNKLLLRFIVMHSYRIDCTKGLRNVLKQGKSLLKTAKEANGLRIRLYVLLMKEYLIRKLR